MKIKIFAVFALSMLLLPLPACIVTSHDYNMAFSCDDFAENSRYHTDYELEVGDKIRLELCSNASTGLRWEYQMTPEGILLTEDHDYQEPEGDLIGAPGIEFWTFEADTVGKTEVQMKYRKPNDTDATWTYDLTVTVVE